MFGRWTEPVWAKKFAAPYVHIVFGARQTGKLHYLRTKAGAEVDFIIEREGTLTPIEVKWTDNPTLSDARHLLVFLGEHPKQTTRGYLVCRCQAPLQLHDKVTALLWFCL